MISPWDVAQAGTLDSWPIIANTMDSIPFNVMVSSEQGGIVCDQVVGTPINLDLDKL